MRWLLALAISLGLLGCDYFISPDTIVVRLRHASNHPYSPSVLYKDSTLWLDTDYDYSSGDNICSYQKCRMVSLLLIGKQQYLGKPYDTLDVVKLYGKLHIESHYMFDNSYKILGDSLQVRLGQSNGEDTMYTEGYYSVR